MSEPVESARRFLLADGAFEPIDPTPVPTETLLVADSWLVAEGRARAIDLHRRRFIDSARAQGFDDEPTLSHFWQAALDAIPPVHRWFPRVELNARSRTASRTPGSPASTRRPGALRPDDFTDAPTHSLTLLMRIAPTPLTTIALATHRGPNPWNAPTVKGPDLHTLPALRAEAAALEADEAVILTPDGHVLDGASTAILWWRGDELHLPPASLPRVDSVTARTIRVLAQATGVPVIEELATPASLAGCEVWAVNALHGIRSVTAWPGEWMPGTDAPAPRARLWQRRLASLDRPLS